MREQTALKADTELAGGLFRSKGQLQPLDSKPQLVTSKRSLKKVKMDGIFGGRNKTYYDEHGMSKTPYTLFRTGHDLRGETP